MNPTDRDVSGAPVPARRLSAVLAALLLTGAVVFAQVPAPPAKQPIVFSPIRTATEHG